MKTVVLRYMHNLSPSRFVVSDKVADDLLLAFQMVKSDAGVDPVVRIVDEDQPLPPLEGRPSGRSDYRQQEGNPGSVALVDLHALGAIRVAPFKGYDTVWKDFGDR